MRRTSTLALCAAALLLCASSLPAVAEHHENVAAQAEAAVEAATEAATDAATEPATEAAIQAASAAMSEAPGTAEVEAEPEAAAAPSNAYVRNLAFVGERAAQLAEAIPQEAYSWRPMEGVRSVSESIMHMAAANYFFAGRLGTPMPEGVDPQGMESITDKAECVAALKTSLDHLGKALGAVQDTEATVDIFGREGTAEDFMQIAIGHVHEHFGQLIAYARSNQIVPPWSR